MAQTILVVDDDAFNRKVVSAVLSRAGFEVETAESGPEALERIDAVRPDLLVLDVTMPKVDGYEVCRRLRHRPSYAHLPVLMLTANDTLEQKIQGFEAGADDYMTKPFQPAELAARVQALLRRAAATVRPETAPAEAKVIAVFSLRGGVGVSTLASNVALGLVQIWEKQAVLVDLALSCGQSALMLGLPLRNTLADLAHVPEDELDDELVDQVLLSHPAGLRVLAAPPSPELGEMVTGEVVSGVLKSLCTRNHYLVLDLPHDFRETTLVGLDMAHQIMVVMAPEMASVYATRCAFDVFDRLGYERDRVFLVLNRTFAKRGLKRAEIERALSQCVNFEIPFAPEPLVEAVNRGAPPVVASPESGIGVLFEDLAYFMGKEEHRARRPERPTATWKRVMGRHQGRRQK